MTAVLSDPVLRGAADFGKYLNPEQTRLYLDGYGQPGTAGRLTVTQQIQQNRHTLTLSQVLARIGNTINANASVIQAKTGVYVGTAADFKEFTEARSLEEVNEAMAAEVVADMISPGDGQQQREQAVIHAAIQLGAVPTIGVRDAAAVLAAGITLWANAWGIVLDDWIAYYKAHPNAKPEDFINTYAVAGSGKDLLAALGGGIDKLARHPLKALRRIFVTEVGKAIRAVGRNILDAEANAPWLAAFFTKPLGFHLQAVALEQIGNVLVDGSISTFNEQAFTRATGETLSAAGRALLAASPFLPPPYNVAAAALGALSVACGGLITNTLDAKEQQRANDAKARAQSAALTQAANEQAEYDRKVAVAAGLEWTAAPLTYAGGVELATLFVRRPGDTTWTAVAAFVEGSGWNWF